MSHSLDTGQAGRLVGPNLGPKLVQRLSEDDTSRQRVKVIILVLVYNPLKSS